MSNIVQLNSLDEEDEGFMEFIDTLKSGNVNAIFLIEKDNGEWAVGSNFQDRRDLVMAMYRLKRLAENLANEER